MIISLIMANKNEQQLSVTVTVSPRKRTIGKTYISATWTQQKDCLNPYRLGPTCPPMSLDLICLRWKVNHRLKVSNQDKWQESKLSAKTRTDQFNTISLHFHPVKGTPTNSKPTWNLLEQSGMDSTAKVQFSKPNNEWTTKKHRKKIAPYPYEPFGQTNPMKLFSWHFDRTYL